MRKIDKIILCRILAGVVFAISCGAVHAETPLLPQPEAQPDIFNVLDPIIVTATLSARAQKDVAGEVSTISASEIEPHQAQDIRDLVHYEPGVSVDADDSRFGLGGFSIHGLGGDRRTEARYAGFMGIPAEATI